MTHSCHTLVEINQSPMRFSIIALLATADRAEFVDTGETPFAKLSWDEALVLSLPSFHGRGFLTGFLALGD